MIPIVRNRNFLFLLVYSKEIVIAVLNIAYFLFVYMKSQHGLRYVTLYECGRKQWKQESGVQLCLGK